MTQTKPRLYIVDTTMRDGEQRAGLAFSVADKIACARLMDEAGVDQIEAGTPSMGKEEQEAISGMMRERSRSRISAWNRLSRDDIRASFVCKPDIIHIGVPVSDLQIAHKLRRDRAWVEEQMRACAAFALDAGYTVTLGFEDASRADQAFVLHLARAARELGVRNIRYADTVGIAHPSKVEKEVGTLCAVAPVECHVHNDLGLAEANSIAAAKAGAAYVDTTFCGIGERAGNCDFTRFVRAAAGRFALSVPTEEQALQALEQRVSRCLRLHAE